MEKKTFTYKDSGVDIKAGEELVHSIKDLVKETHGVEVLSNIGGFGGFFKPNLTTIKNPVFVSSVDGVGTKLIVAYKAQKYDTVGQDFVNHCINDIAVCGATPLFFLDYFSTGKLEQKTGVEVIKGFATACKENNVALIGGETAEMPGMYHDGDYDIAGFCVGVVEADDVIDGTNVKPGQKLIALGSSGPHSNGYSLVRKIIEVSGADVNETLNDKPIIDHLLEPTRIYVKSVLALLETVKVSAISHITGGGFWENIPRVLPEDAKVVIDESTWEWPAIFSWLQENGNVTRHEMYRTFNCGVGLVIVVDEADADNAVSILKAHGENAWLIGDIAAKDGDEQVEINA